MILSGNAKQGLTSQGSCRSECFYHLYSSEIFVANLWRRNLYLLAFAGSMNQALKRGLRLQVYSLRHTWERGAQYGTCTLSCSLFTRRQYPLDRLYGLALSLDISLIIINSDISVDGILALTHEGHHSCRSIMPMAQPAEMHSWMGRNNLEWSSWFVGNSNVSFGSIFSQLLDKLHSN